LSGFFLVHYGILADFAANRNPIANTETLCYNETMPNYFTDNQDIRFLLDHFDLREIAAIAPS
jgi:hypothetical protein